MCESAVCHLIMGSIRLLTSHFSTIALWSTWTSSNRPGAQAPHPRISLGALIPIFVRLSLHYSESLAIPRLQKPHARAMLYSNIERPTGHSNHDFWVHWNLFY